MDENVREKFGKQLILHEVTGESEIFDGIII
jgi:hypothetical protein